MRAIQILSKPQKDYKDMQSKHTEKVERFYMIQCSPLIMR